MFTTDQQGAATRPFGLSIADGLAPSRGRRPRSFTLSARSLARRVRRPRAQPPGSRAGVKGVAGAVTRSVAWIAAAMLPGRIGGG
jgi:hypothetical protein